MMPTHHFTSTLAAQLSSVLLAVIALGTTIPGIAADVRIISSGGAQQILRTLAPQFEKASGKTVEVVIAVVGTIEQKLIAGEKADIVLLPVQLLERIEKNRAFIAESRNVIARVGIGVAVRDGAVMPDVSSTEALRALFVQTRSISFPDPQQTPSGGHLLNVFEKLGIADIMRPKITYRNAIEGGINLVRDGQIETGLYLATEILPAKGVRLAGTLPAALQGYIVYSAAVAAGSGAASAAAQFVRFMTSSSAIEQWKNAGFEIPLAP